MGKTHVNHASTVTLIMTGDSNPLSKNATKKVNNKTKGPLHPSLSLLWAQANIIRGPPWVMGSTHADYALTVT